MTSTSNGTNHRLVIQQQNDNLFTGTATFTGTWGELNSSSNTAVSGSLTHDAQGNVHITFSWGSHSFAGTITGTAGHYHIDGTVTVIGGGGPGHVIGNEVPPSFVNVLFNMTSLTNGTSHQLVIKTQSDNSNGTASFTGVWDGQNGGGAAASGTLSYDAQGNVHIAFTFGNHSFVGTITGTPGFYHIDGYVTVPGGGGPGHVVGGQPFHFPFPIYLDPVDPVEITHLS